MNKQIMGAAMAMAEENTRKGENVLCNAPIGKMIGYTLCPPAAMVAMTIQAEQDKKKEYEKATTEEQKKQLDDFYAIVTIISIAIPLIALAIAVF